MSKVAFLKVTNNQEKLFKLTDTIQRHFDLGHKILVFVPSAEVAEYIDLLIWRLPDESFVPHKIKDEACTDPVVITSKLENLNQASVLLNLCSKVHPQFKDYQTIYELYDETHPVKLESSKARHTEYETQGYGVAFY